MVGRPAEDLDLPRVRPEDVHDHPQRGGLAAPFGPSRPKTLFLGTSRERSFTATWPAKAFRIPLRTMALSFMDPSRRFYTQRRWAPSPRDETRGLALVAFSTIAYGILPILGKVAYAAGVSALPLLAWRYVIAAALIALLVRGPRPPLRERVRLWAIGAVFVFNSIAYFRALETIPASVTALVLYTYPVIVALFAAFLGVEPLTGRALLAAIGAFAGCALTAAGAPSGAPLASSGVAWALAAALIYASYIVLSSRYGAGVPARLLALHLAQARRSSAWRSPSRTAASPCPSTRAASPPSPASASFPRSWP